MASLLVEFLNEESKHPWQWGEYDCTMMIARWINLQTGKFPGESYRGIAKNGFGALRLLHKGGGLSTLAIKAANEVGLLRTISPEEGDVGVIMGPVQFKTKIAITEVMAIRLRDLWCARTMYGIVAAKQVECKMAWRVV